MPITLQDTVPAFQAPATSGVTVTEQDLLGRYTVIYFYPKDSTSGCTTESQEFSAQYAAFQDANCQIFGVSRDSLKSHESFKAAHSMPFAHADIDVLHSHRQCVFIYMCIRVGQRQVLRTHLCAHHHCRFPTDGAPLLCAYIGCGWA